MELRATTRKWHQLGERKLQRESWQLTGPQWRCCEGDAWAVAPLGCLVAVVSNRLDPSSSLPENVKCQLRIFRGGSCGLVTCIPWLVRLETLLALQWTDSALLVAIFANACVRVFSAHGEFVQHFYLFFSDKESRGVPIDPSVVTICTWGGGAVYVSKETTCLYIQRGFDGRDCTHFSLREYSLHVVALGVVPREEWLDSVLIISRVDGACFMGLQDLIKCRDLEDFQRYAQEIQLPTNVVYDDIILCNHAVSLCDATYFAFREKTTGLVASMRYRHGRVDLLWHGKLDTKGSLYVVDGGIVALVLNDSVAFVDSGSTIISVDFPVKALCASSDVGGGLRIFTDSRSEFFKIVSPDSQAVFSEASCSPAAVLLRNEMFHAGDVKACETLRLIRDDMAEATSVCISAAVDCWDFDTASMLLDAAAFGTSMGSVQGTTRADILPAITVSDEKMVATALGDLPPSTREHGDTIDPIAQDTPMVIAKPESRYSPVTIDTESDCKTRFTGSRSTALAMLRVANALRSNPSDIRTNASQLISIGAQLLVGLLAAQNCHLLALRVSDFLGVDKNAVLIHWVRTRVKLGAHMTDIELVEAITKLLDGYAGVILPYADIAAAAARERRSSLALALLDRERSLPRRFRTLCSWGELSKAASVAAEAFDLMYAAVVVLKAQQGSNLDRIVELANGNTCVRDVFVKQCRLAGAADVLQIFLERIDDIFGAGVNAARQALTFLRKPVTSDTRPAMHQLVSHISTQSNTQAEDCSTWLKFSSDFFGSVAVSKNTNGSGTPDSAKLWHECISQQRELLSVQHELERSSTTLADIGLVGRSLVFTVFSLYRLDRAKEAAALAERFHMPFNQHWRCRLAAAHDVHNINDLLRMANDKTAHAQYVCLKNGKSPIDLVLEALLSLGATSAVETVAATLRYPHQQQWRNRLNARTGGTVSQQTAEEAPSLLSSISKRIWH
ncbi:Vacuolar protein sorting-associated protein 16 -like protein [Babesia sp. Xinjiang]|uniref:Vacuolar protein sorting-associated protein 16 -like protein n=1 Tax=Babesia sp. Xinjiang TaxID=462227 RepID=UPI000A245A4E|nr:Vacuolar protein sorting-associated protein 16 -like protein [Babesia sp. Xinjiang]ORM39551.1 Vacuolar protein sorting-associated protein 16 -like protein [Babesia sp. Xinjiang]